MSVINTNVKAMMAQESMRTSNLKLSTTMERLATGLRINSAKDDAAGLAITNRMTAQSRGFAMAIRNANDGISMAQTADGAYGQVTSMLQRMRELAVQASNGSLTGDDRASLQLEISELQQEIDNVANTTNFNNIKLLDGSATKITLQTGANELDTIEVGFNSVKTKDIGSGDRPAVTSVGGDSTTNARLRAFVAGDLTLNGVLVGASLSVYDEKSYQSSTTTTDAGYNGSSAIAKAQAINMVSEQSGVYAKVNDTIVAGTTMPDDPATASNGLSGAITINNVATDTVTLTSDNEINRQLVVQAINNVSDRTGVRAVNTGDNKQGVTLVADDGRNITLATLGGTLTSTATGLGTGNVTYVGTYSLYSLDGRDIEVDYRVGNESTADNVGLQIGTYTSDTAIMVGFERSATTGAPAEGDVGVLKGDTMLINGISINASLDTDDPASASTLDAGGAAITSSTKRSSAIAIAAAINKKTDEHGVRASAEANVVRGSSFTGTSTDNGTIELNGVEITVSASNRDALVDRINEFTGQTGVVARAYGDALELVAEDGRNISIGSGLAAALIGLGDVTIGTVGGAATHYASVKLESDKAFEIARGNAGTDSGNLESLGFRVGVFGGSDSGTKVADVDLTTQLGAQMAISAIDHAIDDVAASQARSGAFQNRLDSIVSILSESNENISAARSRILDTDYATETTALAKSQIVQQAATAMLAQANQQSQSVLALLQ